MGGDSFYRKGFASCFRTHSVSSSWHREKGLKIQWVDDTHALGVFPCLASGNAASRWPWPFLCLPLTREGSPGSGVRAHLSKWIGSPCPARPARKLRGSSAGARPGSALRSEASESGEVC